jgi:hypothetical protein
MHHCTIERSIALGATVTDEQARSCVDDDGWIVVVAN